MNNFQRDMLFIKQHRWEALQVFVVMLMVGGLICYEVVSPIERLVDLISKLP
jgi:hypothetical protein